MNVGAEAATLNLGWSPVDDQDVALHEISHAMGFAHEHQSPFAGIVWNEAKVIADLKQPPNSWDEATIRQNVLDKLPANSVEGTAWDKNSVMQYPIPAGWIAQPAEYAGGLRPAGGLSAQDKAAVLRLYPAIDAGEKLGQLHLLISEKLRIGAGEQATFGFRPLETRWYDFATIGRADTVAVLVDGAGTKIAADDDAGVDRNAHLKARLEAGRSYELRIRLYWANRRDEVAVICW